jgi:Kef-type K+ transport system membrane component KefB
VLHTSEPGRGGHDIRDYLSRAWCVLAIIVATAIAGLIATTLRLGTTAVPVVVLELVFGVVLGPHVLGLKVTPFIAFFGNVGLGLLFS